MAIESEIFNIQPSETPSATTPKLLRATAHTNLFRVEREGKMLLVKTTKDKTEYSRELLKREWELAAGCNHPHIIHALSLEEFEGLGLAIVMEYIEGRTMAQWLAENPPQSERRRVFEELLAALGYLHRRGIIHNDLKPENLLISRTDNSLVLIDLGLADKDAYVALKRLGCTPRYASPELLERGAVDARSDIYTIGIIMGELFGSRHRRIAARCCTPRPERRYANIAALLRAWHRRNLGWWVVAIFLFVMALTIPLAQRASEERTEQQAKEQQEQATKTIFEKITDDVTARYQIGIDSIAVARYREFAEAIANNFYYDMWLYHTSLLPTIEDEALRTEATEHFTLTVSPCNVAIWDKAEELPELHESGLSAREINYYQELLLQGKPFEPFDE